MAKVRTQVYLEEDQERDLKLLANSTKKSFSELIREGVDLVIKNNSPKKNKKFGEGVIGISNKNLRGKSGTEIINEYYQNFGE